MSDMNAWELSLMIMAQLIRSEHGKIHFIKLSHFGHDDQNIPILWKLWKWSGGRVKLL